MVDTSYGWQSAILLHGTRFWTRLHPQAIGMDSAGSASSSPLLPLKYIAQGQHLGASALPISSV
jgi:hypothetical protein